MYSVRGQNAPVQPLQILGISGHESTAEGFGLFCRVLALDVDADCVTGVVRCVVLAGDDVTADTGKALFSGAFGIHNPFPHLFEFRMFRSGFSMLQNPAAYTGDLYHFGKEAVYVSVCNRRPASFSGCG